MENKQNSKKTLELILELINEEYGRQNEENRRSLKKTAEQALEKYKERNKENGQILEKIAGQALEEYERKDEEIIRIKNKMEEVILLRQLQFSTQALDEAIQVLNEAFVKMKEEVSTELPMIWSKSQELANKFLQKLTTKL